MLYYDDMNIRRNISEVLTNWEEISENLTENWEEMGGFDRLDYHKKRQENRRGLEGLGLE